MIKLVWPKGFVKLVRRILMWIAGSASSWYDALIISSNYFCWTWMFAHFVEFKTFIITVPVCPLNSIFLHGFVVGKVWWRCNDITSSNRDHMPWSLYYCLSRPFSYTFEVSCFVFVVRFLCIRWFPCIRHSIIFWRFPHVMVRVPLQRFSFSNKSSIKIPPNKPMVSN